MRVIIAVASATLAVIYAERLRELQPIIVQALLSWQLYAAVAALAFVKMVVGFLRVRAPWVFSGCPLPSQWCPAIVRLCCNVTLMSMCVVMDDVALQNDVPSVRVESNLGASQLCPVHCHSCLTPTCARTGCPVTAVWSLCCADADVAAAKPPKKGEVPMDLKARPGVVSCYDPATLNKIGEVHAMTPDEVRVWTDHHRWSTMGLPPSSFSDTYGIPCLR